MKNTVFLISLCCLLAVGCSEQNTSSQKASDTASAQASTESKSPVHAPREQNAYLSQGQAMQRSSRVSNVAYELSFVLTGDERFSGISRINFDLKDNDNNLTIDLNQAEISEIVVNGTLIDIQYNDWFITLDKSVLAVGNNQVDVTYTRAHSTNGEGLHRFQDPVDNKVYLYTHFEPAAAQQLFAGFDQPDLKATFTMDVTAPEDWFVFTATKEVSVDQENGTKRWQFEKTPKLSTYNFSLHAGPYHVWEQLDYRYPLRLFARQSVKDQVQPDQWFEFTKQGFEFFDKYYDIPYPFKKYDQVIVPEFLYGAMENAAAITFAEGRFLTRGEKTQAQRQRLALVILHEMAHQWFGNLVTMKWWNGLWLNESFASFMATNAAANATEFDNAWQSFYSGSKQGAYTQDQRVTSHPIEVPIPSSANAFDNIDAITYSKGASVLKQLTHLLGEETFRLGVSNYLKKYAYQNATLDDFIDALGDTAKRDLSQWNQEWLYQAGVNTISPEFVCTDGKISQFVIQQTAPEQFPTIREQKVQVGLFSLNDSGTELIKKTDVIYAGNTTDVIDLIGSPCPDLVYPNYGDWGFVKVDLDPQSFSAAQQFVSKVDDTLLRSMLWQSMWDSVRDGKLGLNEYLTTVLNNISQEKDYTVLGQVLGNLSSAKSYLNIILGKDHPYNIKVTKQMEALLWQQALANNSNQNMLRRWFGSYLSVSDSTDSFKRFEQLLGGETLIENLKLNQSLRWRMIRKLNQYDVKGSDALIEQELAIDNTDSGQRSALSAQAIRPDPIAKKRWLNAIQTQDKAYTFSKLRIIMGSLYPSTQLSLSEQTAKERLTTLGEIDKANGPVFMRSYVSLIPTACNAESVARLDIAIKQYEQVSANTRRALLVRHQEDQRCVAIKNALSI